MAIARSLKRYLNDRNVQYELVPHPHSHSSLESAHNAHVPEHQVAKAIVLEDEHGYVVAVVPSTNHLDLGWIEATLGRRMKLADEDELPDLFGDCELGAIPAFSRAYGLDVVWDDQFRGEPHVYIEAGDHEHLIHLRGEAFDRLMAGMPHSVISAKREYSEWMR